MKENTTSIVREGVERAAKNLTERLEKFGFRRTRKMFWVRNKTNSADFIHLHRGGISYGQPINYSVDFRVHCGNRKHCDIFDSLALNGPNSASLETRKHRYHLRFNAKSGSTYERCLDDIEKFIIEIGEPWFHSLEQESHPIDCPEETILASYKLLGIKGQKR